MTEEKDKIVFETILNTVSSELKPLFDAKDNYEKKFCQKCKKLPPPYDDHMCARCQYRLCRECDDSTDILRWIEVSEDKDEYICYKCAGEKKKKRKKENILVVPSILNG